VNSVAVLFLLFYTLYLYIQSIATVNTMNTTTNSVILSALIAVSLFSAFAFVAPAVVSATTLQNSAKNAVTGATNENVRAIIQAHAPIAKDGSQGAYGFGVLTEKGLDGVIVATTHGGVKDSADQANESDPVWHTHYVKLAVGASGLCGDNPEVVDITFESPGDVAVNNKLLAMKNLPPTFEGTNALTGQETTIEPGNKVGNVVAFGLEPKFEGESLKAVCVVEITPSDHLTIANKIR
jgi:hypothetical protein